MSNSGESCDVDERETPILIQALHWRFTTDECQLKTTATLLLTWGLLPELCTRRFPGVSFHTMSASESVLHCFQPSAATAWPTACPI